MKEVPFLSKIVYKRVRAWTSLGAEPPLNVMAFEHKCILVSKRVSLLLNEPLPDKIALTSGANKSEFPHFQKLRTFT